MSCPPHCTLHKVRSTNDHHITEQVATICIKACALPALHFSVFFLVVDEVDKAPSANHSNQINRCCAVESWLVAMCFIRNADGNSRIAGSKIGTF